MKKSNRIAPFSIAFLFLTICAACKKNHSSPTDNTPPRVTLITQAVWKFDTSGIDTNKDGIIDVGDNTNTVILPCFKDNTFQFNKDSTGVENSGAIKCNPSEPQTTAFTWSFSGTDQSVIKSDADPLLAAGINIFSLDANKIVLYKDTTIFAQNIWYVVTLKH